MIGLLHLQGEIMKKCSDCDEGEAWRRGRCKPCDYRTSQTYERTPKGFLMRAYRNMLGRTKGLTTRSNHLYKGLPICEKEEFYKWSMQSDSGFLELLENYRKSGFERSLAPSVDRKDKYRGYLLDNMRWMTISENVSLIVKSHEEIKELPIGITKKGKRYAVCKTFRKTRYYKSFLKLEDAKEYLLSILEDRIKPD